MSHSFPPPPKIRPWWKFRSLKTLRDDRTQYHAFLGDYNARRADKGLRPVKYPNWLQRHKVLAAVVGTPVALFLLIFAIALVMVIADPPSTTVAPPPEAVTAPAAPPASSSNPTSGVPTPNDPVPTPTAENTVATEKARQESAAAARKAEQERVAAAKTEAVAKAAAAKKEAVAAAAAKKKAADAAKAKKELAAKKKAAAVAKKKAAADAKKKATAAAKKKAVQQAAARRQREQAAQDLKDTFDNCTDMNSTYPHGVGLPGASDHTSGSSKVRNFKVSKRVYKLNSGSDRDDDGIACEKR